MARPPGPPSSYHCAICQGEFPGREQLIQHAISCEASTNTQVCAACKWPFPDSLALEEHQRINGHGLQELICPTCKRSFTTNRALSEHNKQPGLCGSPSLFTCGNCSSSFANKREHKAHVQFPNPCSDAFRKTPPKVERIGHANSTVTTPVTTPVVLSADLVAASETYSNSDSDMPSNLSDDNEWCPRCKTSFRSMGALRAHEFRCVTTNSTPRTSGAAQKADPHFTPVVDQQIPRLHTASIFASKHAPATEAENTTAPTSFSNTHTVDPILTATTNLSAHPARQARQPEAQYQAAPVLIIASSVVTSSNTFACNVQGCNKSFRSEPGLKIHKADVHGIGGKGLDVTGKDSWMLGQRAREDLRASGQLQAPPFRGPSSSRGRSRGGLSSQAPVPSAPAPQIQLAVHRGPPPMNRLPPPTAFAPPRQAPSQVPIRPVSVANTSAALLDCGPLEFDQAEKLKGKILRLLIPADIFIRHDGKMEASGLMWTRIGVEKQGLVLGLLDKMCHLPRGLQSDNYVPTPKTFANECDIIDCNMNEFQESPPRDRTKPGLDVVALSCAKVVLANGRQEVVKIAAVDVPSGRILMSYLVCTDCVARVSNWRTSETGIVSWKDMEQAHEYGYKVLKGWIAARLALSKFIDSETIVVGHTIRADLDALRMIHGRAVDVAILAEKAAKGPLSKSQLKIDNLCRDFLDVHLTTDPQFGRDALMDAYACRGLALWIVKNGNEMDKVMRKKSADYQKVI